MVWADLSKMQKLQKPCVDGEGLSKWKPTLPYLSPVQTLPWTYFYAAWALDSAYSLTVWSFWMKKAHKIFQVFLGGKRWERKKWSYILQFCSLSAIFSLPFQWPCYLRDGSRNTKELIRLCDTLWCPAPNNPQPWRWTNHGGGRLWKEEALKHFFTLAPH